MKRLVSLLLVVCMLLPSLALGETLEPVDDSLFVDLPDETLQVPVEDDAQIVLPDTEDFVVTPNEGVTAPDTRELVMLQPTDLFGIAMNTTTIRLTWSPVAFATNYNVFRKLIGETEYTHIASTPSDQLYFEDTAVTPGQVRYYRISAVNITDGVPNESMQSKTLPFITLATPVLSDPRGMDEDTIRLNWSSIAGATTYEVEIADSPNGPFNLIRQDLTGNLCNINELVNGRGYYFRVRAVRTFSSGEKFYSNYSNVGCGVATPRPVLNVTADGNNAVLTWDACPGANSYIIYRKVGDSSYQKLAIVQNATSYIDAGRVPGEVCYYYMYSSTPVGAYNCFSLSSDRRYFTVVSPAVITAVRNTGANEQTIDWTGPDGTINCVGASHYLVYSATDMNGLYTEIGKTAAPVTQFIATGLEDGKTYYYKVRAIREFSNGDVSYGPWSNIMSMPEAGVLYLDALTGTNLTYAQTFGGDITGGYVGDVFNWNVNAYGGSGEYTFRWSLVPLTGGGSSIIIKDFGEGYQALEEDEIYLTDTCSLVLTDAHIDLINNKKAAIQVEVRDSLGAVASMMACEDTQKELVFVGAKPVTKIENITMRAGDFLDMDHGIYDAAGDPPMMQYANPTGAVHVSGNRITALSNGFATVLITSTRFKNDVIVAYHITVGYAPLSINSIEPCASTLNNYSNLSWDINFTGGRPDYVVNYKVYRDSVLVNEYTRTESVSGMLSSNYQPTVPGNYFLEVTITAADGQEVVKRSPVTKVVKYNPVIVTPSVSTAKVGDTIRWIATYTGTGIAVRRDYTLFRDGVAVASSVGTNEFVFNHTATVAGSYVMKVIVYESNGNRIEVTSSTVTVTASSGGSGSTVTEGTKGTVNAKRVAMRRTPTTEGSNIIRRVDKGQTVTILRTQGIWSYIEYRGNKGWMMSEFITIK